MQAGLVVFAFVETVISLANPRAGAPTAIQRQFEVQQHRTLFLITAAQAEPWRIVHHIGVTLGIPQLQPQSGQVLGFLAAQVFLCRLGSRLAGTQAQVLCQRLVDPRLGFIGLRWFDWQGMADANQRRLSLAGQAAQGLVGIVGQALGIDHAGMGTVEAGLRRKHVVLVREAGVIALPGLVQLPLEGA
ncbi:hypothetical protein FQZ97_727130 [compost metagenome]